MIKVEFFGPQGSGKTTAIRFAIKKLSDLGFKCVNLEEDRGGITKSFKGIVFTSSLSDGNLNFDIENDVQQALDYPAVSDQVELAYHRALAQVAEWKTQPAGTEPLGTDFFIKTTSPALFNLMNTGAFDAEVGSAIRRLVDVAWANGHAEALDEQEDRLNSESETNHPLPHPGYLVWNPQGPHQPDYVHKFPENAAAEAERLANAYPENTFFIMVPRGGFRASMRPPAATFRKIEDSENRAFDLDCEIPF